MTQKHANSFQHNKNPKQLLADREQEGPRFRYLTDLPQFSAVVENPQCLKTMEMSQMSLLDKIRIENDQICNSSVYDENKVFDTKIVDEMRFSFSHNEPLDIDNRGSNCSDIVSKYHQENNRITQKISSNAHQRSLMRKKEAIRVQVMNQGVETIKNKYLHTQGIINKIDQAHTKNQKAPEDNPSKKVNINQNETSTTNNRSADKTFNKINIQAKNMERPQQEAILPLSRQQLSAIKEKTKQQPLVHAQTKREKLMNFERQNLDLNYLQTLFQILDKNQTGKIDSSNCCMDGIRQELQLIFGVIFYRIKFNSEAFTKKQLVQLSLECLRLLGPFSPVSLLKELHVNWLSQKKISEQAQCSSCRKLSRDQGVSLYRLLESPPKEKEKNQVSQTREHQSSAITRRAYVNLKETRYQNQSPSEKANKKAQLNDRQDVSIGKENISGIKIDKYQGKYIKHSNQITTLEPSSSSNEARYTSNKLEKRTEQIKRQTTSKEKNVYRYLTNTQEQSIQEEEEDKSKIKSTIPKKKRNISEEMLIEHKRNLEELMKLNEKMENYISHRPADDPQYPPNKDYPYEGQYSTARF